MKIGILYEQGQNRGRAGAAGDGLDNPVSWERSLGMHDHCE